MQETSLFLYSIMHIQIIMDGLGIKSLGSVVWHKTVHISCYTAIYTANFTGYQAKLFKRNKKGIARGEKEYDTQHSLNYNPVWFLCKTLQKPSNLQILLSKLISKFLPISIMAK